VHAKSKTARLQETRFFEALAELVTISPLDWEIKRQALETVLFWLLRAKHKSLQTTIFQVLTLTFQLNAQLNVRLNEVLN